MSSPSREKPTLRRRHTAGIIVLGLAILALLPAAYRMAQPFLSAFVLAAILAVVLDPLQKRASRLATRSSIAALLTTAVGVAPILAIILLAGIVIEREIKSGALAGLLDTGQRLTSTVSFDRHAAIQQAVAELTQLGGALFTAALTVVFLYVLLLHGKGWVTQLTAMLPLDQSVTTRILSTTKDSIVANVDGIVAVGAADAVAFGIVFWIAGVGSPALWGALAGLASLVPVVGGMVVWLPIGVVFAIHGAYGKALIVGLGCLTAQMAVATFLRPRVVGSRLQQPSLLIALSVLGGTDAFGALGILLGPVIASVLAALAHEFRVELAPSGEPNAEANVSSS